MSQQQTSFACPICRKECPTLRDWLTCHPRELRAVTEIIGRTNEMRLAAVARGHVTAGVWRKALALLGTEDTDERNAAA